MNMETVDQIRTCVTCGEEFPERITGMVSHSECYDCEEANRDNSYTGDDFDEE